MLSFTGSIPVKATLEHRSIAKSFVSEKIDQLKEESEKVSENLKWVSSHLEELKLANKQIKHQFGDKKANRWTIDQIKNSIDKAIEQLKNLKLEVDTLIEDFCD